MSQPATSLLSYYGQSSGPEGLGIKMPVSPEEVGLGGRAGGGEGREGQAHASAPSAVCRPAARVFCAAGAGHHRAQLLAGQRGSGGPAAVHWGEGAAAMAQARVPARPPACQCLHACTTCLPVCQCPHVHARTRTRAQGTYGPFQPNMPTDVPLWMALMLRKRKKCRIQPPAWMSVENLKGRGPRGGARCAAVRGLGCPRTRAHAHAPLPCAMRRHVQPREGAAALPAPALLLHRARRVAVPCGPDRHVWRRTLWRGACLTWWRALPRGVCLACDVRARCRGARAPGTRARGTQHAHRAARAGPAADRGHPAGAAEQDQDGPAESRPGGAGACSQGPRTLRPPAQLLRPAWQRVLRARLLQVLRGRTVVKLNNLAAGECNMIRLLLKGTLDHLYELTKVRRGAPGHCGCWNAQRCDAGARAKASSLAS